MSGNTILQFDYFAEFEIFKQKYFGSDVISGHILYLRGKAWTTFWFLKKKHFET
jgi:hypothetical protein